jgi:autotransporter-associated beta strand protein
LTVQSNALAIITGGTGDQIADNNAVVLNTGGVLDLNGNSETVGSVANNNGVLRNGLVGSTASLTASGIVTLTGASCVFDDPDSAASLIVTATDVTGSGSLVKSGLGLLNLSTNSYTGNTTISNGTLVLNFPNIATNSTVTVNTNATLGTNGVLTLNFANSETNVVAALVLGGVSKSAGVYNATTDPLFITGTGSIQVVPLSTINPLPGPILFTSSGGVLGLGWPTNAGWELQSNSVGLTATNSWFAYPNSTNLTNVNIPIDLTKTNVFYRLLRPF